jgi:hypothetical protein
MAAYIAAAIIYLLLPSLIDTSSILTLLVFTGAALAAEMALKRRSGGQTHQ